LRAAAAWIRASDLVMNGTRGLNGPASSSVAMALTRPPGHHATKMTSNGFCLYNFAAAAALSVLLDRRNSSDAVRVSILDWDVHYGQGVADIARQHPNLRYVSIHQCPAFPYLGETFGVQGSHENVMTIPVQAGVTWGTCNALLDELVLESIRYSRSRTYLSI